MLSPQLLGFLFLFISIFSRPTNGVTNIQKEGERLTVIKGDKPDYNVKSNLASQKSFDNSVRMTGPVPVSFKHSDGTFNLKAYHNEQNHVVLKDRASRDRLIELELLYLERRRDDLLQRRVFNDFLEIDTDTNNITTGSVVTFGVGIPTQPVTFVLDLQGSDIIIPSATMKKSGSVVLVPGLVSKSIIIETSPGIFTMVNTTGQYGTDVIAIPRYNTTYRTTSPQWLLNMYIYGIPIAGGVISLSTIQLAPPGRGRPIDQLMANVLFLFNVVVKYRTQILTTAGKRDLPWNSELPLSYHTEIVFGKSNSNEYISPTIYFPVVGTPGITQKLLWQISMGSVSVGSTMTQLQIGMVQFDLAHSLIYLDNAIVQQIYANIPNSKVPTARSPFYTYYCRSPPTVSFNAIDVSGTARLLTLNALDWNYGQSFDTPGWCIGAIQSLPLGSTSSSIGLQFFQSFYSAFQLDGLGEQGLRMGFATALRI